MTLHPIWWRRARLAAACGVALAALTLTTTSVARAGADVAAAPAGHDAGPVVTISGGAVRGAAVPGVWPSSCCLTPLPLPAICGGGPRGRRPDGGESATPPTSRRAARRRRARSCL